MNILPKKRWHVRTKENIARVRKDEAEAAEKEKEERQRIENADREARLSVLKHKSKQRLEEYGVPAPTDIEPQEQQTPVETEHINLFSDFDHFIKTTNKEHEHEEKEKKEEYEKKIGYLTYLGQDTNEALKKKNWYEVAPDSSRFQRSDQIKDTYDKLVLKDPDGKPKTKQLDDKNGEVSWKAKQRLDPANAFKKYCHSTPTTSKVSKPVEVKPKDDYAQIMVEIKSTHKSKKKKHKKDKSEKEDKAKKLQKLREARLKREHQERRKAELFLSGANKAPSTIVEESTSRVKPKYNSQFNPQLARQNYR